VFEMSKYRSIMSKFKNNAALQKKFTLKTIGALIEHLLIYLQEDEARKLLKDKYNEVFGMGSVKGDEKEGLTE
jgi:hypothetical protein